MSKPDLSSSSSEPVLSMAVTAEPATAVTRRPAYRRRDVLGRIAALSALPVVAGSATVAGGLTGCQRQSAASAASLPIADAKGHLLWQNWSGLNHAYPAQRIAADSPQALGARLASAPVPIRVLGAGHSFNAQCVTEGTALSIDGWSGIRAVDTTALTATVKAGTRLMQLGEELARTGQEMWSLPDINKQTLAGAISTGTHGAGLHIPAMHGRVHSFELVTPTGQVLNCSPETNAELFHSALVGLGSFGIVTEYTLLNWPLARTRRETQVVPLKKMLGEWENLRQQHRNAEFYYLPFTDLAVRILHDTTTDAPIPRPADQDMDGLMDLKKLRDWASWSTALRKRIAQALGNKHSPEVAVDEAWKLLSSERTIRFNEMEYHLPLEHQLPALEEIIHLIETQFPEVFFPVECRVVAADEQAWLSPFYQRATGSIAVHSYYREDHTAVFGAIEKIFRRYGGRPHWGKLHSLKAAELKELYPRWQQVAAVRQQVDPQNRMLNAYLRALWGA